MRAKSIRWNLVLWTKRGSFDNSAPELRGLCRDLIECDYKTNQIKRAPTGPQTHTYPANGGILRKVNADTQWRDAAVTDILYGATHLINVASGGFGWRLALWRRPIDGLSPDGAGWTVGLHGSIWRTKPATTCHKFHAFVVVLVTRFTVFMAHRV